MVCYLCAAGGFDRHGQQIYKGGTDVRERTGFYYFDAPRGNAKDHIIANAIVNE